MKEAGDLMSEQSQHIHFENTNRWSTKQLVTMALMCALGALFMYVQLPILPSAPFLTYDPSLVPAMVCGFAYGPGAGTAVAAMAIVIHALTTGDWVGAIMNLVATLGYILPAAIVYQKMHTYKGAVIGLALGVIAATALSMVANPYHWRLVLVWLGRCDRPAHDSRRFAVQPHRDRAQLGVDAGSVQGGL